MTIRSKHNNLLNYFLYDSKNLSKAYIKKALEEERPLDDLKCLLVYVAKCFDDYKRGNN